MKFSVIVPIYNKADYVARALRSIEAQSFRDFELILVDDGSVDNSLKIAKKTVSEFTCPVTFIQQENAGVSAARNNGAAISKGDFLCFLDADDWWSPTFLDEMAYHISQYSEAGLYACSYFYVKNGSNQIRIDIPSGYINYFAEYIKHMQMPIWTGAVCIPANVFKEFGGFNPSLCLGEDFELWAKIYTKYKIAFLNKALAFYFQDIRPTDRLIGKLHVPEKHMLWGSSFLNKLEAQNADFKTLIDKLRVYCLKPYYIDHRYHDKAVELLSKVEWERQDPKNIRYYSTSILVLKCWRIVISIGSWVKSSLIRFV